MNTLFYLYLVHCSLSLFFCNFSTGLLSPEFFKQSLHQRAVSPGSFFSSFQDGYGAQKGVQRPNQHMDQKRAAASEPRVSRCVLAKFLDTILE